MMTPIIIILVDSNDQQTLSATSLQVTAIKQWFAAIIPGESLSFTVGTWKTDM